MQQTIVVSTNSREGLYDITDMVKNVLSESNVQSGLLNVYVRGATAAIMIQENWDQSVQNDVVTLMRKLIPAGVWQHDQQDGNGDSHLKSGLVGPQETIPFQSGELLLSTWQNVFLCEFDGPRAKREIVITIVSC